MASPTIPPHLGVKTCWVPAVLSHCGAVLGLSFLGHAISCSAGSQLEGGNSNDPGPQGTDINRHFWNDFEMQRMGSCSLKKAVCARY